MTESTGGIKQISAFFILNFISSSTNTVIRAINNIERAFSRHALKLSDLQDLQAEPKRHDICPAVRRLGKKVQRQSQERFKKNLPAKYFDLVGRRRYLP